MELSSFLFEKNDKKPIEADLYVKIAVYNITINRQTFGILRVFSCRATYVFSSIEREPHSVSFFTRIKKQFGNFVWINTLKNSVNIPKVRLDLNAHIDVHRGIETKQIQLNIWFRFVVLHVIFIHLVTCLEYRFTCWSCSSTLYFGYRLIFPHLFNEIQTIITKHISFEYLYHLNSSVRRLMLKIHLLK